MHLRRMLLLALILSILSQLWWGAGASFVSAAAAPTILSPADNSTGVSSGALTATMSFPEVMHKGYSGSIMLKRMSDHATIDTIFMGTQSDRVQVDGTGKIVSISFTAALALNTQYYILVDSAVLLDGANNPFAGIVDPNGWNFTTLAATDTTPPLIMSMSPSQGSTISAVGSPLTIKFNEPVKIGSGAIIIQRLTTPSGFFCTIPMTSPAVTGSGTDTLTINPSFPALGCGNFTQNTQYSVTINEQAITDIAGNHFTGVAYGSWLFSIIFDAGNPELINTTPTNGNKAVKTTEKFTMQFNEEIIVQPGAMAELKTGSTTVTFPIVRDSTDLKKAYFEVSGLRAATSYVVHIPNNAITDLWLNPYPGILNDYRWTFTTVGTDRTPPKVTGTTMEGSTIVLTYDEELDPNFVPFPANYYVTVSEVPMQVDAVAVISNTVRLTLHSGIAAGQVVKVSYTVDSRAANKLQDLSANLAASFNGQSVTNVTNTANARPSNGIVSGNTISLNFSGALQTASPAVSQFTVKINGVSQNVTAASISNTTLTLTMSGSAANGQSVSVSYVPGASPLRDLVGNAVSAFADFYVQNTNDTQAPTLLTATASGAQVRLTYNEGLSPTQLPSRTNFIVISGGKILTVSGVSIENNTVELTLSQAIESGATVFLSYTPGNPGIVDLSGNPAGTLNGQSVTVTATSADVVMAVVMNNVLTLFYNRALSTATIPQPSQYMVRSGTSYYAVSSVNVQGSQVNMTLVTPVPSGVATTLSYNKAGTSLKDTTGFIFDSFTDLNVNNSDSGTSTGGGTNTGGGTTTPSGLPDYLESDGSGGVRFVVSKSTTTEFGTLPSGRSGNRYAIDGTKLLAAYDVIRSGTSYGVSNPVLSVTIPSTEQSAQVSIPIRSMMDAAAKASNASLRVEFGEMQFTLPLTAINYGKELYLANADSSNAKLVLSIEKTQDVNLSSALSINSAELLATPADFSAGLLVGSQVRPVEGYDMYVTRAFTLPSFTGNVDNVAVVRYDNDAGEMVYVPTRITQSGSTAKVEFLRKNNSVYTVVRKNIAYSDMTSHWARNTVNALASKFIVDGPSRSTFAPDKNITRAEFAEYLARGLGLNGDKAAAARFPDVGVGHASAGYIGAVSKAGIVEGGSDGNFRPKASITREEMATMLVRAMTYAGVSTVSTPTALNAYKDKGKVSSWAKEGMSICVMAGFIKGASATELKPQNNATRAEATVMLERFLKYAELL